MSGETVSADDLESVNIEGSPSLVRVFRATSPLERSLRIPLAGVTQIELGRADTASLGGRDVLQMTEPDERMSSNHARLVRSGRRFTVVDAARRTARS